MLLRSGDNLLNEVKSFINQAQQVRIFSPFITVSKLKEILGDTHCESIVVRWQVNDILMGVCDFEELYEYCKNERITLYRNIEIHLKAIDNRQGEVIFGSANISNKGLGDKSFNWELAGKAQELDLPTRTYLNNIIANSDLVDNDYFETLEERVIELREEFTKPSILEEVQIPYNKSKFLLSALPMSISPDRLLEINFQKGESPNQQEMDCAAADLANYSIPDNVKEEDFFKELGKSVNNHPFIVKLKEAISHKHNHYMGYTEIIVWLQNNTVTVPTPRRWDIRDAKMVQILHRWITRFDDNFISIINYPNGSDRLTYTANNFNN